MKDQAAGQILEHLSMRSEASAQEIAHRLRLPSSKVARLLRQLFQAGYVVGSRPHRWKLAPLKPCPACESVDLDILPSRTPTTWFPQHTDDQDDEPAPNRFVSFECNQCGEKFTVTVAPPITHQAPPPYSTR